MQTRDDFILGALGRMQLRDRKLSLLPSFQREQEAVNGVWVPGQTQTVEHYRIIETYRATGSTPYSPALAARASSSSVLRPGTGEDLSLDDCMGSPLIGSTGIVAAKETHGQQHLGSSPESQGQSPTMPGH